MSLHCMSLEYSDIISKIAIASQIQSQYHCNKGQMVHQGVTDERYEISHDRLVVYSSAASSMLTVSLSAKNPATASLGRGQTASL